ncbi:MAG: hypothetical protein ACRD1A_10885, partial [Terriglobales bacterium]
KKCWNQLESVCRNPRAFPTVHKNIRRAIMHRFPYAVFYGLDGATVIVLAVVHGRRWPPHP